MGRAGLGRAGQFYAMLGAGALLCVTLTAFAWRQPFRALAPGASSSPGLRRLE